VGIRVGFYNIVLDFAILKFLNKINVLWNGNKIVLDFTTLIPYFKHIPKSLIA